MADVDIFVGNTVMIDTDVYQLWLNGYSGENEGDNIGISTRLDTKMLKCAT